MELDHNTVIIKRRWISAIVETALSPLSIFSAGYSWATESIERRIGRWRLEGEDERVSLSEMMNGEVATIIGVIAGALAGVCASKMADMNGGTSFETYGWYLLLVAIVFGIILFYKWMRNQIWNSRRSAWEPYVPASAAKQTLYHEWRTLPVKVKWKSTAECALKKYEFDALMSATDRAFLVCRLIIGAGYAGIMLLQFRGDILGGVLAASCILGACFGVIFSVARDYCLVAARSKRFTARLRVLNNRLKDSDLKQDRGEMLDEIDTLISRLEKLKS